MTGAELDKALGAFGLMIYGGYHPVADETVPEGTQTLVLVGPGTDYWPHFTASPEWQDGTPDPVDRWSSRVLAHLAEDLSATAFLPFGGPPYVPFLSWAIKTGRCWSSPVGMLVHDTTGLFVSFRGALALPEHLDLPPPPLAPPCETCPDQPCRTTCPVSALGANGYDTDACHGYLETKAGADCLTNGCAARLACPVSAGANRQPEQSAHHMRYFHKSPPRL